MLHRKITEHWVWGDPVKLKWWIDILITVNHADEKVNLGLKLIECKRGQSVMSLQNWARRWGVSKGAARNFLELLKRDGMIEMESVSVSTRITVCNYDDYQRGAHASKTDEKRMVNASKTRRDPNNNDNNDNNDNKNIPAVKSAVTLHSLCKNLFLEKYRTMYKEEYYWDAKSGANLKHIINKIKFNRNAKGMNVDDDSLLSAFGFFLDSIDDNWLLQNFSIPNINSKFNEIVSKARFHKKDETPEWQRLTIWTLDGKQKKSAFKDYLDTLESRGKERVRFLKYAD